MSGAATDDAPNGWVEFQICLFAEGLRKQFAEPFLFDLCREGEKDLALFVAAFDLAHFGGNQKAGMVDGAFTRKDAASIVDEGAAQRPYIEANGDLVQSGPARRVYRATIDLSDFS